ncbi:hypothetical protein [Mesorhizobium sp. INR15]|uniref:hypothetical protein n=1 Tax=Mesorhizobium sp. INR15 TaxID=2654248 RepID=UPI00189684FF|nr:hypothetical protein [Mesorhizobium sp. INR15]QPC91637.1 hypothetical protein GA829_14095 [Mesorhizobium sp. INR15]
MKATSGGMAVPSVTAAVIAGMVYFASVFVVGFVLGTARTLWIAPAIGNLWGVLIELPFILGASWLACGRSLQRFSISSLPERLIMGLLAFMLLMVVEAMLAVLVFGTSLSGYAAGWGSAAGALGLLGQICFAGMPLVYPQHQASASSKFR